MSSPYRPRRGSLGFSPRKRAKSEITRIRSYPQISEVRLLGFAGYKAGMTHVIMIDDVPTSPTSGMEIAVPATVIETPPLHIAGIRYYQKGVYGWRVIHEDREGKGEPELPDGTHDIRALVHTHPEMITGVPKKKPEFMEIAVGGTSVEEKFEYLSERLGKDISIREVFKEGQLIDVSAVTKGKGTQGPVKRWGVMTQDEKHGRSSRRRHVGTLGPWHPARVSWRVPQLGQTGYHQRTELNKKILKIGENGEEITPEGGFVKYGVVRSEYILVKGSVPGPKKRLIRMRDAIRPSETEIRPPQIVYISRKSQQG
ncbi:MAG: large subunit ribosomal protein [Archaeoglobi archaeon]|nr:50S ribosomal protein L3 [Candidatus Mnemosynella bozhongmuii]MDI3502974.1 large subunit ribosomal protein [Archaeoglobi archaeon]MDK2781021.1 large subunit ribosomal protein [Archaeoglobi archaeon]